MTAKQPHIVLRALSAFGLFCVKLTVAMAFFTAIQIVASDASRDLGPAEMVYLVMVSFWLGLFTIFLFWLGSKMKRRPPGA